MTLGNMRERPSGHFLHWVKVRNPDALAPRVMTIR
jgi:hypothetical protein